MSNFFESLGGALKSFRRDTEAILNVDANRSNLLRSVKQACAASDFLVEVVRQPAVLPALEVAVRLGDKEHSAIFEYGGDTWQDIVFAIANQLTDCDEATVFVQLEAREARAYVCCTQLKDGKQRVRKVTLVDVIDQHNLVSAYLEASKERR